MEIGSKEIWLDDSRLVRFRPVTSEDGPVLFAIYGSTRTDELAMTNWDEAQRDAFLRMQFDAQQSHYREYYPDGEHMLIEVNGDPVGRLYVVDTKDEVEILDITVLPQHRNKGIGRPIIRELMSEAGASAKPLRIYVETFNPSVRLFEGLGFVKSGEQGVNYLLEWRAPTP